MINIRVVANGLVFITFLAIPLIAEVVTATPENVPGTGFDILFYEPFDFAYVILVGVLFLGLNCYFSAKKKKSILKYGIAVGAVLLFFWFIVSFILVAELHVRLGGIL